MNIIFLTLSNIKNLEHDGIYANLLKEFVKNGHTVSIVAPAERRYQEETNFKQFENYNVLRIKVGNLQKTNLIEKGISTIMLETQFLAAIKKYYNNTKFDLVIYSTPPITFTKVINYIKRRDNAKSYLLLKDIFPQNAVDLGMFSKKSPIYAYFRAKEKQLYKQSDYIGCMSQANVDYVIKHNPQIDKNRVHISPNSIEVKEHKNDAKKKTQIRKKYSIPEDAAVFVYGGNLGKPQGIPFVIDCLRDNMGKSDRFFVICGAGTEYSKLKAFVDNEKPDNVLLINGLPKDEYDDFIVSCDVGLIFLDHRFTIPNFPSRLLSYMQNAMSVIACTDVNTDIGQVITQGGFGWWCESNDVNAFTKIIDEVINLGDLQEKGLNARKYLIENYSVECTIRAILNNVGE